MILLFLVFLALVIIALKLHFSWISDLRKDLKRINEDNALLKVQLLKLIDILNEKYHR